MLIAGNWKMFKTAAETLEFCRVLRDRLDGLEGVDVVVCPPYTSLDEAVGILAATEVAVFAQNAHWAQEGPFTGEVSAPMLKELGVAGSLVAHSERRQLFAETDETAAMRIEGALDAGLHVIACVGETEQERDVGETENVLRRQVDAIRTVVADENLERLAIAYEPVWAIGTGLTATSDQAQEACAFVRALVEGFDKAASEQVRVLYGGSLKPGDAEELLALPDVDGGLIGGASLDPDDFLAIVDAVP